MKIKGSLSSIFHCKAVALNGAIPKVSLRLMQLPVLIVLRICAIIFLQEGNYGNVRRQVETNER